MATLISAYDVASFISEKDLSVSEQTKFLSRLYGCYGGLLEDFVSGKVFDRRVCRYLYCDKKETDALESQTKVKIESRDEQKDHKDYAALKRIILTMIEKGQTCATYSINELLKDSKNGKLTKRWVTNLSCVCHSCHINVSCEYGIIKGNGKELFDEKVFMKLQLDDWVRFELN